MTLDALKPDYRGKKKRYIEASSKVKDLIMRKNTVKDSLNGFLIMFEVKKETTLQNLSHQL
jgi:hypothetical protein